MTQENAKRWIDPALSRGREKLDPAEIRFLERQTQIHLMQAHVALVEASGCVVEGSPLDQDLGKALGAIQDALRKTGMEIPT